MLAASQIMLIITREYKDSFLTEMKSANETPLMSEVTVNNSKLKLGICFEKAAQ
jgi:hypothetical protein